ncbi:MAG: permease [Candidatus Omnitrophota bacterium]|nr:permease [Candidatus Omnitrophota bacterium]
MSGRLAEAINFFIYDTAKIFILLAVIIFVVAIVRSFFPAERARAILSHEKKYIGNVAAALLGIVTPFCTCSAIPLFLGFVEAGIPLGVTFSFLISSPMINEVALVMLWGMFGWKIAVIYIASGFVIAVVSGIVLGELKLEGLLENIEPKKRATDALLAEPSWKDRFRYAWRYTADILRTVGPFVVIGIAIGAFIHGYAPQDLLVKYAGKGNWLAVPVATLIGIPLYSNAAGTIPMVSALVEKGMGIGTALAFMMAVTGLSLPEFLILRRVMKTRLLLIFAAIVGIGIIFTGYLFNLIVL